MKDDDSGNGKARHDGQLLLLSNGTNRSNAARRKSGSVPKRLAGARRGCTQAVKTHDNALMVARAGRPGGRARSRARY
jgi:hypothetical protein